MKKDPSRYIPRPSGHSAPWNRSVPAPPPAPVAKHRPLNARPSIADRWPWVVLAAMIVAAAGWLIYDAAAGA
jgi:hypothetical protein